jgi:4-amino-4-deoxy-L-arabinose transferase-like glycosyltransferase
VRNRLGALVPLVAVVVAAVATALALNAGVLSADRALSWDEGFHAMFGLRIADDLRHGQALGFLYDSYREVMWPPAHSWMLGLLFAAAGPATRLARGASLAALVATVVVTYLAGRLLGPPDETLARGIAGRRAGQAGIVSGLAAAAAVLCSAGMLDMSTQIFTESLAGLWLVIAFWLYFHVMGRRRAESETRVWFGALGAVVFVAFLARYNFGAVLAMALTAACLLDGGWLRTSARRTVEERRLGRGHLAAASVLAVLLAAWFAYLPKLPRTWSWIVVPTTERRFSLEGLAYFPSHTLGMTGSWTLLVCSVAAFGWCVRPGVLRAEPRVRLVAIFALVEFVLMEVSGNKQERYLLPLVPAFALMMGYAAGRIRTGLGGSSTARRAARVAFGAAILVTAFALTGDNVRKLTAAAQPAARPTLPGAIVEEIAAHGPALVISTVARAQSPAEIDWQLIVNRRMAFAGAGSISANLSERQFASRWGPRLPARLSQVIERQVNRYPGRTGTFTAYMNWPLDLPDEFTAGNFRGRVAALLAAHPEDRILVAAMTSDPVVTPAFIGRELGGLGYVGDGGPRPVATDWELLWFARR